MSNDLIFPHTIDSTMLSTFRACPQKFFRQYIQHWKPKGESVHLIAGGAFAAGLETARRAFYDEGHSPQDAVAAGAQTLMARYGDFECPADSAKSLERMLGALEFYFDRYPLGVDEARPVRLPGGRSGIEFSFAEPLPIAHPVTGDPILYTGRADMIAEYAGGIYVFDEKTTSSLGPSWSKQWDMRSQFTGYCWAGRQAGLDIKGAIVRGVSILKTKYDTQQALTYRPEWEVQRWLVQVQRDLSRMIQLWDFANGLQRLGRDPAGGWDYDLDSACEAYGGCAFKSVCRSPDPAAWLPMYFEQRVWDPLARKQMTVEEYEAKWAGNPLDVMAP